MCAYGHILYTYIHPKYLLPLPLTRIMMLARRALILHILIWRTRLCNSRRKLIRHPTNTRVDIDPMQRNTPTTPKGLLRGEVRVPAHPRRRLRRISPVDAGDNEIEGNALKK